MIRFNDPDAIVAIANAARCRFVRGWDQCVARYDPNGDLLGGFLFTDYNVGSIQAHVAGFEPHWLDRSLLYLAFDYCFNRLNLKKVILTIRSTNDKSLAFAKHLGFNEETRVRDVFADADMLILCMYKAECRFLSMRPPHITFEGNHGEVGPVS
jgi:RimJ/RimL family protein N-acetyltransferase